VAAGLVIVASGLWRLTTLTVSDGFAQALLGMVLLGLGAGLIIAPATASVMGSLPRQRAGVGSATNSTALQVGGALGVAVIGSVLSSRYQGSLAPVLAGRSVPAAAAHAILSSIGGALTVAHMAGGKLGSALASAARVGFIDGMHASLLVGAIVVALSALLVLIALPARSRESRDPSLPQDPEDPQMAPSDAASAHSSEATPPGPLLEVKAGTGSAR
jgi:hypothetical protein